MSLHFDMESVCFELSGRAIGDAAAIDAKNFAFVVGGVEYKCCRFQACCVSGLVRRLLASDCCLSSVSLKVSDGACYFEDVVRLMNGQKISITPVNMSFLEACARELENDELLGRIVGVRLAEDISMSNVAERIRIKSEFHSDSKREFDFLASHFFEASCEALRSLSISDLELVLTNPLLKLKSEDQLYDAIISLSREKGEEHLSLLKHVEFMFLSDSRLSEFLDRIFPDFVDARMWKSLCECVRRFCWSSAKVSLMKVGRYPIEFSTFTSEDGAFNGIVRHLKEKCGGNPHEKDEISITASSCCGGCPRLVDYGWNNFWGSDNEPNSFVQFDFKSRCVCLSQYSLKSDGCGHHLLSWVIEVSDDGSTWEVVDERTTQDLNGNYIEKTYECSKRSDRFVRFVRLRQTGKNSSGIDSLYLSEIEFFGKLTK